MTRTEKLIPENDLSEYINEIRERYLKNGIPAASQAQDKESVHNTEKVFMEGIDVEYGHKYAKVVGTLPGTGKIAHSFIVLKEKDGKFKRGDVLKANSWLQPARNFNRGNIFDKSFKKHLDWNGVK